MGGAHQKSKSSWLGGYAAAQQDDTCIVKQVRICILSESRLVKRLRLVTYIWGARSFLFPLQLCLSHCKYCSLLTPKFIGMGATTAVVITNE